MSTTPDPTEELLLSEAAGVLGLSPGGLRQAIHRGQLDARTQQTPRGPVRWVTRDAIERYRALHKGRRGRPPGGGRTPPGGGVL